MAILDVLRFPDERLRTVAAPVETITPELQQIVDDMFETMYAEEGIGLAATQVDIHQRIIVIDAGKVVMDGPKAQVLAALSGARPMPQQGAPAAPTNVHRHPSTQPADSKAAV